MDKMCTKGHLKIIITKGRLIESRMDERNAE